jgi:hypothetical protein
MTKDRVQWQVLLRAVIKYWVNTRNHFLIRLQLTLCNDPVTTLDAK